MTFFSQLTICPSFKKAKRGSWATLLTRATLSNRLCQILCSYYRMDFSYDASLVLLSHFSLFLSLLSLIKGVPVGDSWRPLLEIMFIFVIYECYFLLICYGLHVYGHLPWFTLISMDDINPTNFSRPSVTNLSSGLFCRGSNSFLYWYIQERNTTWKKIAVASALLPTKYK